ncbi:hypothetical protein EYF80_022676 [Liparis tanakae]|uniref:Uncharacterized protein n=1 Tax=Liparis tanakae TaxID=230148 RepID=A0A4Z2HMS5_9TELE|nr:hypothetical protein EYF80_022676 [Liparis tanakae]
MASSDTQRSINTSSCSRRRNVNALTCPTPPSHFDGASVKRPSRYAAQITRLSRYTEEFKKPDRNRPPQHVGSVAPSLLRPRSSFPFLIGGHTDEI